MKQNVCQMCGEVWSKHHYCSVYEPPSPPKHDPVDRPAHYQGDIECIDAIKSQLTEEQWVGYLRGQVAKYNWRIGRKGEAEHDAKKLLWYAKMLAGVDPRKG